MMKFRPMPTQEQIHAALDYDPMSGVFTWASEPTSGMCRIGLEAGSKSKTGYILIGIGGRNRQYGAHRLAWVYVHGSIPDGVEIDHIDGNPSNNSIANLRPATSSEQKRNKGVQRNNRSGLKGAYYHACHKGKKWRTQIKVGERLIFLGYFHTAEEAHAAYVAAANKHFGEFARAA